MSMFRAKPSLCALSVLSVLSAAGMMAALPPRALAADPPSQSKEESSATEAGITPGLPAAQYYEAATLNLRRGRFFLRAAAQMREALKQEPDNFQYHSALGCALMSRAAAIADAANHFGRFAQDKAKYTERLDTWEIAQKDRTNPLYGQARPVPPVLRTKDDKKPFTLTMTESADQVTRLGTEAMAQWNEALKLAKTDAERAESEYVRGWGLRLLRAYGKIVHFEKLPAEAEVMESFAATTKLDPGNAAYWQALGDAFAGERFSVTQSTHPKEAIAAYRKSLSIKDQNPTLWYRLYQFLRDRDPAEAKQALEQAVRSDPGNAFLAYRMAAILFAGTKYQDFRKTVADKGPDVAIETAKSIHTETNRDSARKAITFIERGNKALAFVPVEYRPAIPELLKAIGNYQGMFGDLDVIDSRVSSSFYLPVVGYASAAALHGDTSEGIRASRALIGAGYKMMGDLLTPNVPLSLVQYMIGTRSESVAYAGYSSLRRVYQEAGNETEAARAAMERAALEARVEARLRASEEARASEYGDY